MKTRNKSSFQESGYDENLTSNFSEYLTDIKPIKTTGTTCDAFSARYESRRVFVKRLKPEHSSNSRYRQAFQKEYELGVSLRHPSIPQYIKFTGDTLIIEFIDGKTLHQMIQKDDPRLHIEGNIEKWVGQLLDVMDYLHTRNVIHCDIKTDNIMITNDTRNLMLIDFDKAFTASKDLTPGTPLNYGKKEENLTKRQMDIRGVRKLLNNFLQYVSSDGLKERIEKVVAACGAPDVTMPELLEIWEQPISVQSDNKPISGRVFAGWWIIGIIIVALLVIVWSYFPKQSPEFIQPEALPEIENPEINFPDEQQELSPIEGLKEKVKPESPDWNSLLTTDVVPMNKLLDRISDEIQTNKISPDSVAGIVMLISNEMNSFNKKVLDTYSTKFPELAQITVMQGIYESEPVKLMVKRRDSILQKLIEIQETKDIEK